MKHHHTTEVARANQWLPVWERNEDLFYARSELACARALHAAGHATTALEHTAHALSLALRTSSPQYQYHALLMHAWLAFESGRVSEGLASLTAGFELGRENGYVRLRFYPNNEQILRTLCARALAAGIEVEYAQSVSLALELRPCAR
jgi:hypothetical protein